MQDFNISLVFIKSSVRKKYGHFGILASTTFSFASALLGTILKGEQGIVFEEI